MAAFSEYLFQRIREDVLFLHSQSLIDDQDRDAILTRIDGAASGSRSGSGSRSTSTPSSAHPVHPAPSTSTSTSTSVDALANQLGTVAVSRPQPATGAPEVERAKALWNYTGSQPDDLSFQKGDTIVIHTKENEHWWRGSVESDPSARAGLFPSNHVEILPPTTAPYSTAPPPPPPTTNAYNRGPPSNYYGGAVTDQEKAALQQQHQQPYYQQPPAPNQYYGQHPPPPPPPQPYYNPAPQAGPVVASPNNDNPDHKKHKFKLGGSGLGNTLAHAGVGGLGFGAGSAVGSGIINSIF